MSRVDVWEWRWEMRMGDRSGRSTTPAIGWVGGRTGVNDRLGRMFDHLEKKQRKKKERKEKGSKGKGARSWETGRTNVDQRDSFGQCLFCSPSQAADYIVPIGMDEQRCTTFDSECCEKDRRSPCMTPAAAVDCDLCPSPTRSS